MENTPEPQDLAREALIAIAELQRVLVSASERLIRTPLSGIDSIDNAIIGWKMLDLTKILDQMPDTRQ